MLADLDRVDWDRLTHAYGPASDTPECIRALASPDAEARKEARGNLSYSIVHQGSRYAATAPAVPFLYELLDDPATPEKDQIIRLLVYMAVGYHERLLPLGMDPAAEFAEADALTPEEAGPEHFDDYSPEVAAFWARSAYEAVLRGVGRLHALALNPDPGTRKAAVFALAWFPAAAPESISVVRRTCRSSAASDELANAILCLGILDRYSQDTSDTPWLQEQLESSKPYPMRATAAISLAVILGKALPTEALDVLLETIQDFQRDEEEGVKVAWNMGSLITEGSEALRFLALEPTEPVLSALCRAVEVVKSWASLSLWNTLLELVFPDREGVRFEPDPTQASGQRVIYRDPTHLSAPQRRAVEALVRSPYWERDLNSFGPWEETLWTYGLPTKQDKLQRLLANEPIDPPAAAVPPKPEEPPLDLQKVCERARAYVEEFEAQDRLFPLQGDVWYTGVSADDRQMLVGFDSTNATIHWFDGDGQYIHSEVIPHNLGPYPGTYWQRDKYPQTQAFLIERFGYQAGTIHIRRFQDPVSGAAIKPGPWWLERFVLDPEWRREQARQYEAKRVLEWIEKRDHYALVMQEGSAHYLIALHDGRCVGT